MAEKTNVVPGKINDLVRAECVQTVGSFDAIGDGGYYACGKQAKWIAPNGATLCTRHRKIVDRVLFHKGQKCKLL